MRRGAAGLRRHGLPRGGRIQPAINTETAASQDDRAKLQISLASALELCRLGLATMIDIRQSFEIELKGAIPDTVHIPMFEVSC
jgi:hypothetical protein